MIFHNANQTMERFAPLLASVRQAPFQQQQVPLPMLQPTEQFQQDYGDNPFWKSFLRQFGQRDMMSGHGYY